MTPNARHAAVVAVLVAVGAILARHDVPEAASRQDQAAPAARCAWAPPVTAKTTVVRNVGDLQRAVGDAKPGTTILLEDGEYRLERMLELTATRVVLRGRSGDATRVVLRGDGMTEQRVGVAIAVGAPDITIADLTAGYVQYHGIQIRGERGASRTVIHNVRVLDTGQQLVKGSAGSTGPYADDGLIACSYFGYSTHAPSNYTDGIDVIAGKHWTVRDNRFERIRGPQDGNWAAGPAILFWGNSQDTIVERNIVLDSFRGIAFGLGPGVSQSARDGERVLDHQGGTIRNNVVVNLNRWADEGIEANSAPGVQIDHNTVFAEGTLGWSISVRFPSTDAIVRNNLTNRQIMFRNGGRASLAGNIAVAAREWFVNPAGADFHLSGPRVPAVRSATTLADVREDFDRMLRTVGGSADAGAFELSGRRP